jgi:hypothetical protein
MSGRKASNPWKGFLAGSWFKLQDAAFKAIITLF